MKVFCENCKYSKQFISLTLPKSVWVCKQVYKAKCDAIYEECSYAKCEDVNTNNSCTMYKKCLFPGLKKAEFL